jgi:selenocysteine lyase/cysteine desulfurase
MGPKEAGLLYVKADNIPRIWPNVVAPGWGNDVDPDPKGARKFESLGQRDDACLASIGTTVDFHNSIGSARVEARMMEMASALKAGISDAGLKLVTPQNPELSGGVCITVVDGERARSREVMNQLYQEHGIAGAPTGGLRLCPHVYNTMAHVERAIAGVKAILT